MFKRIDHIEIIPVDLEKSLDFYLNVLGFKLKSREKMDLGPLQEIVYVTLGDTMIEFLKIKDPGPAPAGPFQKGYRAIAIEVEDMDKTVEHLKGQGVEMPRPPMVIGRSKRGEIKDPSGYPIELRQW